jgi:hypothetical protein
VSKHRLRRRLGGRGSDRTREKDSDPGADSGDTVNFWDAAGHVASGLVVMAFCRA